MKYITFCLIFLTYSSSLANITEWKGCETNNDCVVVKGICNRPDAANMKFLKNFILHVKNQNADSFCIEYKGPKLGAFNAQCKNSKCIIIKRK
jgi:hypothetical protein